MALQKAADTDKTIYMGGQQERQLRSWGVSSGNSYERNTTIPLWQRSQLGPKGLAQRVGIPKTRSNR